MVMSEGGGAAAVRPPAVRRALKYLSSVGSSAKPRLSGCPVTVLARKHPCLVLPA